VLTQPVPAKVECDDANAFEQGHDAQPVTEMAGQPVQQEDRSALSRVGVRKPVRGAILIQGSR
jgi:hypothetical protein